jgi:hypothetical protein
MIPVLGMMEEIYVNIKLLKMVPVSIIIYYFLPSILHGPNFPFYEADESKSLDLTTCHVLP